MPEYENTWVLIVLSWALLATINFIALRFVLKKKAKLARFLPGGYWALSCSFLASIVLMTSWFASLESAGPVGAGIGVFISPIVALIVMVFFFFVGWSLHEAVIGTRRILSGERGVSKGRFSIALLVLAVFSFIVMAYVRAIPGFGVRAVPELDFTNSVGMPMIRLNKGYWVGAYEVTQAQFEQVMGHNPSFHKGQNNPVEYLVGAEAANFCGKLTALERAEENLPDGYVYCLPTYRQWLQYVADANLEGSITPYGHGQYDPHGYPSHLPIGSGDVNRLGLYDLRGNVSEYSSDKSMYGTHFVFGSNWNTHRKDFLLVRNKSYSMKRGGSGGFSTGFRVVLVKRRK